MIRTEVGKQLGLRHTPSVEFFLDGVPESARQIEDLLARARESDEAVRARAEGAQFAGDPDPYRSPGDEDEAP
jgi:ribosome-binding factor A